MGDAPSTRSDAPVAFFQFFLRDLVRWTTELDRVTGGMAERGMDWRMGRGGVVVEGVVNRDWPMFPESVWNTVSLDQTCIPLDTYDWSANEGGREAGPATLSISETSGIDPPADTYQPDRV